MATPARQREGSGPEGQKRKRAAAEGALPQEKAETAGATTAGCCSKIGSCCGTGSAMASGSAAGSGSSSYTPSS